MELLERLHSEEMKRHKAMQRAAEAGATTAETESGIMHRESSTPAVFLYPRFLSVVRAEATPYPRGKATSTVIPAYVRELTTASMKEVVELSPARARRQPASVHVNPSPA